MKSLSLRHTPYQTIGQEGTPLLHNVHVYLSPLLCLLPGCRKTFQPRRRGKRQLFCCPEHRTEFFRLARKVGAALLIESLSDPGLNTLVQNLLRPT